MYVQNNLKKVGGGGGGGGDIGELDTEFYIEALYYWMYQKIRCEALPSIYCFSFSNELYKVSNAGAWMQDFIINPMAPISHLIYDTAILLWLRTVT